MTRDEIIIGLLEGLDRKLDRMSERTDEKFANLGCAGQNLRIDRLEQKEIDRKDSRALIWSGLFAALGAFGLSLWQWLKGQ